MWRVWPSVADRAVGEGQDHGPGVDVAVPGEHLEVAHRPRGIDLHDLLAGDPAERVEVVDRAVAEEAARDRDVVVRRRRVVVGDQPHEVEVAERARVDEPLDLAIARVEPALEAELQDRPFALDQPDEGDRVVEVEGERLLDEHRLAVPSTAASTTDRWAVVETATTTASAARIASPASAHGPPADRRRELRGPRRVEVMDQDLVHARELGGNPRMELAHPPDAEHRDPHRPSSARDRVDDGGPDDRQAGATSGLGNMMSRTVAWRSW